MDDRGMPPRRHITSREDSLRGAAIIAAAGMAAAVAVGVAIAAIVERFV